MASKKTAPALVTISVALSKETAASVKKAAESDRRSVSNWLRIVIEKALEKK